MRSYFQIIVASARLLRPYMLLLALLLTSVTVHAQTVSLFGSLANFDVYNDTGQDAHGFEIELDGITPGQISYVFSSSRYGGPTVIPFAGGIYVRYTSQWNAGTQQFNTTTQMPAAFTPTAGHSCVLAYVQGCDHYGVVITQNGTGVVYRWLLADPQNPGNLIPAPTASPVPHPTITVIPPAKPGLAPAVEFKIEVPPPPPAPSVEAQFGEAKWVKVYKTELPRQVGLDELVGDNAIVPQDPALVETAWKLLQFNPHSANSGVLISHGNLGNGSRAVIRRYEFSKYSGKYDPLNHKAVCVDPLCAFPGDGELGDYIGSQMAAANVGVPSITVSKVGNGSVAGASGKINCGSSCTAVVNANSSVTLTASPSGTIFSGWSGGCNGLDLNCTLMVNDSVNVTATFSPVYTLSIGRSGSGTVIGTPDGVLSTQINCGGSCSAKFKQGTTVTLNATPAPGLSFVSWSGACSGTAPSCSVTLNKDTQVQANFK